MLKKGIIIIISIVLAVYTVMLKPVYARDVPRYSISFGYKKSAMGYSKKIKIYKKKIIVWGAVYSFKKKKILKYKKRIFKSNKSIKYGTDSGPYGVRIDKKLFMECIRGAVTKSGKIKQKYGNYMDIYIKNNKVTKALLGS